MQDARRVQGRFMHEIAADIREWETMPIDAIVLVGALSQANWIDDIINGMSCRVIAMRFLALSKGWRGDKAKRVKNELKALCGMR